MAKRKQPFNNPFAFQRLQPIASRKDSPPEPQVPDGVEDEAELFRQAVGEVTPVPGASRITSAPLSASSLPFVDPDAEAYEKLCALVENEGPMDLSDTDEYMEGAIRGFDRNILKRVRAGDYAIQAHLDLHGFTRDEAKLALVEFTENCRKCSYRLVLVVHGRGLHSKDQIPVLKESVRVWLTRGRVSRHVLAFTSARHYDGGLGAVYVLLRK